MCVNYLRISLGSKLTGQPANYGKQPQNNPVYVGVISTSVLLQVFKHEMEANTHLANAETTTRAAISFTKSVRATRAP